MPRPALTDWQVQSQPPLPGVGKGDHVHTGACVLAGSTVQSLEQVPQVVVSSKFCA